MIFQILITFIVCALCRASTQPVIHIVLGSADETILGERIQTAIVYISESPNPNILFISGGVKNAITNCGAETEASKAANMIKIIGTGAVQIVLEEKATNTAENFVYLKQWVNNNYGNDDLPDVVITTSDFHKNRAEQIFNGVIPEIKPKWNLSKSACMRCWSDESVHMKNVKSDIERALHII